MRPRGNPEANVKSTALRQRADFLAVAGGARVQAPAFVLQSRRRDDLGHIRIGFTVTKKNGTATERNRIRRRLREVVKRVERVALTAHSDYVLVGRRAALTRDFADMVDDLRMAFSRIDRANAARSPGQNGLNDETLTNDR